MVGDKVSIYNCCDIHGDQKKQLRHNLSPNTDPYVWHQFPFQDSERIMKRFLLVVVFQFVHMIKLILCIHLIKNFSSSTITITTIKRCNLHSDTHTQHFYLVYMQWVHCSQLHGNQGVIQEVNWSDNKTSSTQALLNTPTKVLQVYGGDPRLRHTSNISLNALWQPSKPWCCGHIA